jgi:hypothetical protein
MALEFKEFPKIPRLKRNVIVTEKIDGTNASVTVALFNPTVEADTNRVAMVTHEGFNYDIFAGSRNRFITPGNDNFGFATWVLKNANDLVKLGVGTHYGEWWGSGIQRGYGLPKGEKRFSLFNVSRWADRHLYPHPTAYLTDQEILADPLPDGTRWAPLCCHVVPELSFGPQDFAVDAALNELRLHGSHAAPFLNPEGIIVYHTAARQYFKVTLEKDEEPKGKS